MDSDTATLHDEQSIIMVGWKSLNFRHSLVLTFGNYVHREGIDHNTSVSPGQWQDIVCYAYFEVITPNVSSLTIRRASIEWV